jgi:diguanylate cyclase (GGDEF)-like protein/PAS domain S-box-containing protein
VVVALVAAVTGSLASSASGSAGVGRVAVIVAVAVGVATGACVGLLALPVLARLARRTLDLQATRLLDQVLVVARRLAEDPRRAPVPTDQGAVPLPFPRRSVSLLPPPAGPDADGPADQLARVEKALAEVLITSCSHECWSMIDAPGDVVVALGRDGRVAQVSGSSVAMLGWRTHELHGQPIAGLVHVEDLARFSALVDAALDGLPSAERPRVRLRSAVGAWRVLEWAVAAHPERGLVVMAGRDVTEQVQMQADLLHQATHDRLTGLPNRAALLQLATEAVAAAGPAEPLSVVMIDLDRFKDVNDSLGHAVGDQLLAQVGPRLRAALRPHDTIARLGGDEFAVLLPTAGEDGARLVAERLAEELDSPFVVDGMNLHVEASIGIAVSHRDERAETATIEGLLRQADIAMYRAKQDGSGIALFDPERDSSQSRSRLELSGELRRAIGEDELVLHYQPLVDVVEGRIAGVEALVRWQHPERGLLPPAAFLPLAEQTGLILPLSKLVLSTAVAQAAAWQSAGHPIQIAVNLSPRWLQHADVPAIVEALLAEHGVPPELLRLEITESVVLAQPEHALQMLNRLRDMGIGLSLDDFGTGFSSMTHLRNLPVDELKVDRGFVNQMTTSPRDAVIVRAAIELGHNLGMHVVAEGIEDADTLAEVVAAGCSLAQGYYFTRPLPPTDLIAWAAERFGGYGATGDGPIVG